MARLLQLALLVSALAAVSCAAPPPPLKYTDLDPFRQQWTVTFALTSTANKSVFVPHNCTAIKLGLACNKPAMSVEPSHHDKIRINISLKNATTVSNFQTYKGAKPTSIVVKLCYSEASSLDRPWRKANTIISKDKACWKTFTAIPFIANSFNNNTITYNFSAKSDTPQAVHYVRVLVKCGSVFCQYDGTKGKNYFETSTITQITAGLKVAIIVMSLVGPVFMISYMVIDSIRQKRK